MVCEIPFTDGLVPYLVTVMTVNSAGCGAKAQIDCFTRQGGEFG